MKLIIHEGSGKWLSLLILLLFCQGIIAQPKAGKERIDSLLSELPKAKEDTNKYLLLYSISRGCIETGKSQEAIQYGEQALTLATSLHKQNGVKNAHYLIGVGYFGLNEYTKALEHINFVLKSNEESKNKEGISMCNMMIGNIYSHQSNYPKALEYFMKALKIDEERKNAYMLAQDYGSIGQIYSYMKANDKAIEYMLKSVRYAEQIGDKMALSNTYNNLAEIYYNQDKKDIALEYFFKSLKLHIEIGDLPDVATNYNNIGLIYQDKKEYAKGLDFYNKSYEIARQLDDKSRSALCLGNMSLLSILLKNYKLAKVEALKAIGFAKDIGDVDNMRLGYEHLADAEFGLGEYKEAYNSQVLCKKMTDSIFNIENSKQLSDIKTKYEVDKKATELNAANKIKEAIQYAQIKHQKQQKNYFIAGFFISLVFAGFIFRSLRTRNKQNKIITQQKEIVEKEKNRSEELLLNILPSEVAEELKSTGSAKAKNFEEVTVMFTDFKGFTQISEKLTPEQLVLEIDHCFKAFDLIIQKHGIEKIKTIGDSYMCVGGLPKANQTHPENVVKAALEIRDFMIRLKEEKEAKGEAPFEIRIGIHTGPVVAGIVGIKKFAYDIWGDTVNVASRMESSGEAGMVNISGATYELVKNLFRCSYRGKVMAKGKGEVDMYFVEDNV